MVREKIEENISYNLQTKEEKEKNKNTHILKFDMHRNGNVSSLSIDFDIMPHMLSNEFRNLKVYGEGYLLDYIPKESFISERGTNKYKITIVPEYTYIYDIEEIDIENRKINIVCPSCEESISFSLIDNEKYLYDIVCDCCELSIICELDFDIIKFDV